MTTFIKIHIKEKQTNNNYDGVMDIFNMFQIIFYSSYKQ